MNKATPRTLALICATATLLLRAAAAYPQDLRLSGLDALVAKTRQRESASGFDRARLYGTSRNLIAIADRWPQVRAILVKSIAAAGVETSRTADERFLRGKAISTSTLSVSRFSGFTQSETATAWCGSNVLTAFNDTASEIESIAAGGGISAIGFSVSSNRGASFQYIGAPPVGGNYDQEIMGNPSVVCTDTYNFDYSGLWDDSLSNITGVVVGKSTDGGRTFSAPSVAVTKDLGTHFVDHDWIAADMTNPGHLYIVYNDIDYSGNVCGTDPNSGSIIARYAIELVSSSDGGASWSGPPVVVEQVCADAASPYAMVSGPQATVGPQGQVYVAWEAAGENGAPMTSREIKIAKSIDGGALFGAPTVVAQVTPVGDGADLQGFIRAAEFPAIAIGKGAKNEGFVYLAWDDASSDAPDVLSTTSAYGFADVKFSASEDGGSTWSTPLRVNNSVEGGGAAPTDQFSPAIGSDKSGRIGICFYDRRRDPNNFLIDRECAKSVDGGISWHNSKITPVNFPSLVGQDVLVASDYMGEYDWVASDSLNQSAGLIDSYASNAGGHPAVMTNKY